jgi:hypothetical protein
MHDDSMPAAGRAAERLALEVSLMVLLRQAHRLPWESAARRALAQATYPLRDALDQLDDAECIDGDRALQLARVDVDAGFATWDHGEGFRAGPELRARLSELGVSVLPQLRDKHAAELHEWISARAA